MGERGSSTSPNLVEDIQFTAAKIQVHEGSFTWVDVCISISAAGENCKKIAVIRSIFGLNIYLIINRIIATVARQTC